MMHESRNQKLASEALALAFQARYIKACQLDLILYPEEPVGTEITGTALSKPALPCDLGGNEEDFLLRLLTNLLEASFEIDKQLKFYSLLVRIPIPHMEERLHIEIIKCRRTVTLYLLEDGYSDDYTPGHYGLIEGIWNDRTRQAELTGFLRNRDALDWEGNSASKRISEWVSVLRAIKRPWSGAFLLKTPDQKKVKGRCEITFSKVRNLPALNSGFMEALPSYSTETRSSYDRGASPPSKRSRLH